MTLLPSDAFLSLSLSVRLTSPLSLCSDDIAGAGRFGPQPGPPRRRSRLRLTRFPILARKSSCSPHHRRRRLPPPRSVMATTGKKSRLARKVLIIFTFAACAAAAVEEDNVQQESARHARRILAPRKLRLHMGPRRPNQLPPQRAVRRHRDNLMMETRGNAPKVVPPPLPSSDPFADKRSKRLKLNEKHLVKAQSRAQATLPAPPKEDAKVIPKGKGEMSPLPSAKHDQSPTAPQSKSSRRADAGAPLPPATTATLSSGVTRAGEGMRFIMDTLAWNLKNRGGHGKKPRKRLRPKRRRPGPRGPPGKIPQAPLRPQQRPQRHSPAVNHPPPPTRRHQSRKGSNTADSGPRAAPVASAEDSYGSPKAPAAVHQDDYGSPKGAPVREIYKPPPHPSDGKSNTAPSKPAQKGGQVIGYVPTAPRNNFAQTINDVVQPQRDLYFHPPGVGPFKREIKTSKPKKIKEEKFKPVFEPSTPLKRPKLRPTVFPVYPGTTTTSTTVRPPSEDRPLAPVIRHDYDYQYYDTDERGSTIVRELSPAMAGKGEKCGGGERKTFFVPRGLLLKGLFGHLARAVQLGHQEHARQRDRSSQNVSHTFFSTGAPAFRNAQSRVSGGEGYQGQLDFQFPDFGEKPSSSRA